MSLTYRGFIVFAFLLILSMVMQGNTGDKLSAAQAQTSDPVLVGAGDIVKCGRTEHVETAKLLDNIEGTVFTVGDNAYPDGTLAQFTDCYGPTWGRHKDRTRPSVGNHEYHVPGAAGYFTYFGSAASPLDTDCTSDCKGYYSYDLGEWHIIALNSQVPHQVGSAQEQWLRADLQANQRTCTLAYWHKPRFTSGQHGNYTGATPLWQALYDYGADVVLNGHDHTYERFSLQNPSGQADPYRGIREFVVGTGGAVLYSFPGVQPNSEVRNNTTWGVLKLTLHPTSYSWEFVPIAGQTFTDSGSADCVTTSPPANHPPVAVDDAYAIVENTILNVAAPGVLGNDKDVDGDPLTAVLDVPPTSGTLSLNADGSFNYTPEAGFTGTTAFTYYANDGLVNSTVATVTLTIYGFNNPPVVNDDATSTNEDIAVLTNVAVNDADQDGNLEPSSANTGCTTCSNPANGSLTNHADGTFTYTPNPNFNGVDSFVYQICDKLGACDTATVKVTVHPVPDPPVAVDDTISTTEHASVTIDVTVNDNDPDGDLNPHSANTSCASCAGPANGSLVNNLDGSFTYTPSLNFYGSDTFMYEICDLLGACDTATVSIMVNRADLIFSDGFESGDFSAWSSNITDMGDLSVSQVASLVGSYGMQAVIDDKVGIYVTNNLPNAERRYRARFYFDPNSIQMTSGDAHSIFTGYTGANTMIMRVDFRFKNNAYQLRAGLLNDTTTWKNSAWTTISDGPHSIEIDWQAASAEGATNGKLTFWIDGVQKADLNGIDNDTRRIDQVRLGAVTGIDSGTRGTYFFDAFESRKETYIGPAVVTADFNGTPTLSSPPWTVNFTNLSQPVDRITAYLWDFGDGSISTETNPSHTYFTEGVYSVSLTAHGDLGTDTEIKANYIVVAIGSDLIFSDGFEGGDYSAWTTCLTDLGDLSVASAAALEGNYGLQAFINSNTAIYCRDDTPNVESRYRARFYFDPNSIPMVNQDNHVIFGGYNDTSKPVMRVLFRRYNDTYQVRAALINDATTWTSTSWFTIADAPQYLEIDWKASIAAGANNGGLTLWIDGVQQAALTGIDNDTRRIDQVRLGAVNGIDTGTRGIYYFDAFESRREAFIGS